MADVVAKEGIPGRLRLAVAAEKSERMIKNYMDGHSIPSSDTAYKIALACDCGEDDALKIAKEIVPKRARETA